MTVWKCYAFNTFDKFAVIFHIDDVNRGETEAEYLAVLCCCS